MSTDIITKPLEPAHLKDSSLSSLNTVLEEEPLSERDKETFSLIQRWRNREKSLLELSEELGVTKEGLRRRIKSCCYRYSGSNLVYKELVREVVVDKLIDAEDKVMEAAESGNNVAATCAHVMLKHSEWLAERLVPEKFIPKKHIETDNTLRLIVDRGVERKPLIVNDSQ